MRKINAVITVVLSFLATTVWVAVCYHALTYETDHGLSSHFYPALCAVTLTVCALVGWVMVTVGAARGDGETRCRKCRHILRGLSEPRCPECGALI